MPDNYELIRRPEVLRITGLKKSTLYSLMQRTEDPFPPNYPTSERGGLGSRLRYWLGVRDDAG